MSGVDTPTRPAVPGELEVEPTLAIHRQSRVTSIAKLLADSEYEFARSAALVAALDRIEGKEPARR